MRLMLVGPRSPAMGLDDGAANRKASPHSGGLRGHEGLENPLAILLNDAAYRDEQALRRAQFRADHQFASVVIGAGHGLYRVHDQIQQDLLQSNSISPNQWQPLRQPRPHLYELLKQHRSYKLNRFFDGLAQIEGLLAGWHFLDLLSDPTEDAVGSRGLADYAVERLPDLR